MATTLYYGPRDPTVAGGVSLSDISTVSFEQKPVYTDDGVDYLHTEYTIRVHAMYAPGLSPSGPNDSPAKTYADLVGCLSKPRQQLIFKDGGDPAAPGGGAGGTTLLYSPQAAFNVDANNGPMPVTFNVKSLNPGAYSVEFEVKTWQYDCCGGGGLGGGGPADTRADLTTPWVAVRWSETVTIDEKYASKIVRKGKMYFRGDVLSQAAGGKIRADDYRDVVVAACPLRPQFIRTSEYTVQENGLVLEFTITDTEQFAMPLLYVRRWEAEYRMVTVKGSSFREEMHIRVEGDNNTSKFLLFQAAFRIASSRLVFVGDGKRTIVGGYFADKLHENVVELHLVTTNAPAKQSFYGLQFGGKAGVQNKLDPNLDNSRARGSTMDPGPRGSAVALYLAAHALQDPSLICTVGYNLRVEGGGTADATPTPTDDAITPATVNVVPALLTAATDYDTDVLSSANYVDTTMDITYEMDQRTLQMPVASSSTAASSFAVVASPTMRKIVTYSMETVGGFPTLPATVSNDPNEVLLGFQIVPNNVDVEADGATTNWRVTGQYVYGLKDPTNVQITAGRPPWLDVDYGDTVIPSGQFVAGLTSPGGTAIGTKVY